MSKPDQGGVNTQTLKIENKYFGVGKYSIRVRDRVLGIFPTTFSNSDFSSDNFPTGNFSKVRLSHERGSSAAGRTGLGDERL